MVVGWVAVQIAGIVGRIAGMELIEESEVVAKLAKIKV